MKQITCKSVEECLNQAAKELNCSIEDLIYTVDEEKKGLFGLGKSATISVVEIPDVIAYAETYISNICKATGIEVSIKTIAQEGLIKILIETNHNPVLIGKNGETLQALNELVKLAVSNKFKRKFRILLDISEYKNKKYNKVIGIAKRVAKNVLKTHIDTKLDPMTPDERKKVHNALSSWKNIKTESVGDGKDRSIVIKYTGAKNKRSNKLNEQEVNNENIPTTNEEVNVSSNDEGNVSE